MGNLGLEVIGSNVEGIIDAAAPSKAILTGGKVAGTPPTYHAGDIAPLRMNSKGEAIVESATKIDYGSFTATNLLNGTTAEYFTIRDTTERTYLISHASENIIDQVLMLYNTLDKDLTVKVYGYFYGDISTGCVLLQTTLPAAGRLTLEPVVGPNAVETATALIKEVPELQESFYKIGFKIQAAVIPTSGDLKIYFTRRY